MQMWEIVREDDGGGENEDCDRWDLYNGGNPSLLPKLGSGNLGGSSSPPRV